MTAILDIELCLGSACFARGNNDALTALMHFVKASGLERHVRVRGSLCEGQCTEGPLVKINGKRHTRVDGAALIDIVRRHIEGGGT